MLKQTNFETRTLFLKLFTQELILNSKTKIEKEEIREVKEVREEAEKKEIREVKELPKEQLKPRIADLRETTETGEFIPSIMSPIKSTSQIEITPAKKPIPLIRPLPKTSIIPLKKPLIREITTATPKISAVQPLSYATSEIQQKFTMPISTLPKIKREAGLGKLSQFLLDRAITEIECPGPGKFVTVKKAGRINLTKINLSKEEIDAVVEDFSEKARIPVIGGIFKAAVGNLIITAVISEFVGSRFIIHKASPYSLIE